MKKIIDEKIIIKQKKLLLLLLIKINNNLFIIFIITVAPRLSVKFLRENIFVPLNPIAQRQWYQRL
jgi:hypothetical protein